MAALVAGLFVLPVVAQTSSPDNGTAGSTPSTTENSVSSSSGGTLILSGATTYNSSTSIVASNISLNTGSLTFINARPDTAISAGTVTLAQNSGTLINPDFWSGTVGTGSSAGVILTGQTSLGSINTISGNSIVLSGTSAPTLGTATYSQLAANASTLTLSNTMSVTPGSVTISTLGSNPVTLSGSSVLGLRPTSLNLSTSVSQNLVLGSTVNTVDTVAGQLNTQTRPVTISSGTLAVQGVTVMNTSLDLQSSALLRVRLNNTTPGEGHDQLNVSGDVALQGDLAITAAPSLPVGASFTILNKTSAGPISGTFAGRPQGSVVIVNNNDFVISYTGGDGNDVTLTALSRAQAWRHRHFGTTANTGTTADDADFDGDGIPNLIEKACNLDPTKGNALPVTTTVKGSSLEYTYTRSVAAVSAGDIFTVEWNDTLGATGWSSAGVTEEVQSDDGTTQIVKALVPASGSGHRFMRLKVTPAP